MHVRGKFADEDAVQVAKPEAQDLLRKVVGTFVHQVCRPRRANSSRPSNEDDMVLRRFVLLLPTGGPSYTRAASDFKGDARVWKLGGRHNPWKLFCDTSSTWHAPTRTQEGPSS